MTGDFSAPLEEPRHEPVPHLVEAFARSASASPAIAGGERVWCYRELWERAEQLARVLLARQVQPGEAVAVTGPKSFGLIASLLGVLASGAVVVPVDSALPRRRKELMLRETRATLVVVAGADERERTGVRELGLSVVDVHADGRIAAAGAPAAAALPRIDPEAPAYIFFTSGTTGVPRAVLGRHAGLSHFLAWQRETFAVGSGDRVAQLTSLSFDVVLRDIFLPLTSGACLRLPPAVAADVPGLLTWLRDERVTLLHTVPTLARRWLEGPDAVTLPDLRVVFFAGEPLSDVVVAHWRERLRFEGRVVNLYGPTETTLAKCCFVVPAEPAPGVQPIGRPIPQTQVLVLDAHDRLCGIGEAGEIVIRTPFRTLGYMNDPVEQAQRFVPNPCSSDPEDVVFRTRDRGRYRADGAIEILGRMDDQVKIRGVRVEPQEAELQLERHPAVRQVAVVPRPGPNGEPRLVAYVVLAGAPQETIGELRRVLHDVLPAPAIPSVFVQLVALPVTANGKLARDALPAPASPDLEEVEEIEDLAERRIAEIWETVLDTRPIGRADDFFALGGDSLTAMRFAALFGERFGREIGIRDVFERPTVSELAELLAQSARVEA